MKAVRIHKYGGPEVLVYEDVPIPEPGPKQILVRVKAATVNPVDVAIRENRFPTPKAPPKTLGSDGAGIVERLGSEITAVKEGDAVFFSGLGVGSEGSNAEYAVIAETQAVPLPKELSFADGAALGMVFPAAYYALVTRGAVQAGESVLVQGAGGGVGTASVQLAKALGARVLAVVGSPAQAQLARDLGADEVINRRQEDVTQRVLDLTDGAGVNVVHELVISENLPADLGLIAKRGRLICAGQGPSAEVALPIDTALAKDVSLLFMNLNNAGRAGVAAIAREVAAMAAEGRLRIIIGASLPLAQARQAHELLAGEHLGKIVLLPD